MSYELRVWVNGEEKAGFVDAASSLAQFLRDTAGHYDVKTGCGEGDCGTCTVLLDDIAVKACLVFALQADGKRVQTVRALGDGERLHPLQVSFVKNDAVQCGYCTPGMLVAAKALLDRVPLPSRQEVRDALSGNLCRCTGYTKIIDAVREAALEMDRSAPGRRESGR